MGSFARACLLLWVLLAVIRPSIMFAASATNPATQPAPTATQIQASEPDQNWNFHFQNTNIVQGNPGFHAKYSGPESLPRDGETRETVSVDLMAGARLWSGAEAHVDGLMWQGFGLGNSLGAEGFVNGEAYRIGTSDPNATISRLFIRQTIGLGGEQEDVPDGDFTLAGKQDVSRLTFTLGRFAAADVFDLNTYANSPRTQFMNWALINNEGWDYPADSIGYTTGLTAELNQPDCTLRYGFFQIPSTQNGLSGENRILKYPYDPSANGPSNSPSLLRGWGMATEFERRYSVTDHPGVIRFLAYLNRADMAKYTSATRILDTGGAGADISAAQAFRYKYGFGLNWEQEIAKNVGLFSRLGWNDAQEQGWMFTDVGYSGSLGLSFNGEAWNRPGDTFALAGVINGIPHSAQEFFKAGGTGILAGDGNLNYGREKILETYYDFLTWKIVHLSLDYQFISNPAFNRDRGPVSVFGARLHWEF